MNYKFALMAAVLGMVINVALAYTVPQTFSEVKVIREVSDMFQLHKQMVFSSSLLIGVVVFLAMLSAEVSVFYFNGF